MIYDVGVITQFIGNDYCDEIIKGIKNFFSDKPVRVSILEVRSPDAHASDYEFQYWAAMSLAQGKNFKAIILISGTFCSDLQADNLIQIMQPYISCPVISVSVPLAFKDAYTTKVDCKSGIRELINHISKVHGRKKIGMVTAGLTNSDEGRERFESFKEVLKENNLELNEDWIFHSNFSQHVTINVLKDRIPRKENVKFDALFCANDFSAFGAVQYLQELGFKIPEDIIVAGYDDCSQATKVVVPLTTINQNVMGQGYEAAKIAFEIINGNKPDAVIKVPVKPVYRESCGCKSTITSPNTMVGNIPSDAVKYFDNANYNTSYFSLLDKIQSSHTLKEIYQLICRILPEVDVWNFALCLYEDPVIVSRGETFALPEKVQLATCFALKRNEINMDPQITFNPRDSILPEGYLDNFRSDYIVNSIFFGERQYGYMMYTPGLRIPTFYAVYMKILSNTIARSYDYTKSLENQEKLELENRVLQKNNSELSVASQTDEMTKVYNRRGFLFLGQQAINLAIQMNSNGLVIFGDMDGLKKINDTYGHDAGDTAIKAEAQILSKAFRTSDIIGRMGGDEFAIVCPGMKKSAMEDKKLEIQKMCDNWNKETNHPFTLSISLGAAEFSKENFLLDDLLSSADAFQYQEKKLKNSAR